jgi:hypothetical protein
LVKMSHRETLDALEGRSTRRPMEQEDREALNLALCEQTNIDTMTAQGISSQDYRERIRHCMILIAPLFLCCAFPHLSTVNPRNRPGTSSVAPTTPNTGAASTNAGQPTQAESRASTNAGQTTQAAGEASTSKAHNGEEPQNTSGTSGKGKAKQ